VQSFVGDFVKVFVDDRIYALDSKLDKVFHVLASGVPGWLDDVSAIELQARDLMAS
jgi:hypothetical protein